VFWFENGWFGLKGHVACFP